MCRVKRRERCAVRGDGPVTFFRESQAPLNVDTCNHSRRRQIIGLQAPLNVDTCNHPRRRQIIGLQSVGQDALKEHVRNPRSFVKFESFKANHRRVNEQREMDIFQVPASRSEANCIRGAEVSDEFIVTQSVNYPAYQSPTIHRPRGA